MCVLTAAVLLVGATLTSSLNKGAEREAHNDVSESCGKATVRDADE